MRFIRTEEVSMMTSDISKYAAVREKLLDVQRNLARTKDVIMDGRDIGTTVFPDAQLKVFVTSSAEVRAERRYKELLEKGEKVAYEDVLANVVERDHIDETRDESPLRKADDALLIDNSHLSREEQNQWLLDRFNEQC